MADFVARALLGYLVFGLVFGVVGACWRGWTWRQRLELLLLCPLFWPAHTLVFWLIWRGRPR